MCYCDLNQLQPAKSAKRIYRKRKQMIRNHTMKNQDQAKQSITPESWPATYPYHLITDIGIREQEKKNL